MRKSFEQWMREVNLAVEAKIGLSADDLADQPYRAWYDDGMTPKQAAKQALANEGADF